MKKKQTVLSPITPRLPPQLEIWYQSSDQNIEFSQVEATDLDLSDKLRIDIESSKLTGITLSTKLEKLVVSDASLNRFEASGLHPDKVNMLRVEITNSRLTGVDFGASSFEDCLFKNVKLDEAGFKFAIFKRVRFEDCVLSKADFSSAKLNHVTFVNCSFEETNFDNSICKSVDIRGQNLATIKGVLGLKGTTISNEQLIQLGPLLAAELNFTINDV